MQRWVPLDLNNRLFLRCIHLQTLSPKDLLHIFSLYIIKLHQNLLKLLSDRLHLPHQLRILQRLMQISLQLLDIRLRPLGSPTQDCAHILRLALKTPLPNHLPQLLNRSQCQLNGLLPSFPLSPS
jgi:hypothetical protein